METKTELPHKPTSPQKPTSPLQFLWKHWITIILVGVVSYQVAFTWIPLWRSATELSGTDVSQLYIEDSSGKMTSLASFKGKPLIISFWATWCIPCRLEMPLLGQIYPDLQEDGKQLIGVNQREAWDKITKYQQQRSIEFPIFRDQGTLSEKLRIRMIPAVVVINEESQVESITYGFRPWIQAYLLWWI